MPNFQKVILITTRGDVVNECRKVLGESILIESVSDFINLVRSVADYVIFDTSILSKNNFSDFKTIFNQFREKTLFMLYPNIKSEIRKFIVLNSKFCLPFPCKRDFFENVLDEFLGLKSGSGTGCLFTDTGSEKHGLQKLNFLGKSHTARSIRNQLIQAADSDSPVLLCGESGTGKSEAAELIHKFSERCNSKYVRYNSASISEELADGILYGVKTGCFTGAEDSEGLFVRANNGTLFLDEIGAAQAVVQAKLLVPMETGCVYPVGNYDGIKVNVRLIFATNENLDQKLRAHEFRPDFLFRIPIVINFPPLREHCEDITFLAQNFADNNGKVLSDSAVSRLENYDWSGNIRQLKNVVEQACTHNSSPIITADMLQMV